MRERETNGCVRELGVTKPTSFEVYIYPRVARSGAPYGKEEAAAAATKSSQRKESVGVVVGIATTGSGGEAIAFTTEP